MVIVLVILHLAAVVVWLLLARGIPRKQATPLFAVTIFLAALTFGIGFSVGEISPTYRGSIAVQEIVRHASKTLDSGECDRAQLAFAEARQLLQTGGTPQEAVNVLRTRLQGASSTQPASAPVDQP